MKLLHIDSSILGDQSVSRRLSAAIVAAEQSAHPNLEIVRRDLGTTPLPHMTAAFVGATRAAAGGSVPPEDLAAVEEFLAADIVVIGAPMYNFGISSQLKAWIDRLAVPGKTFTYTEAGPKGLAGSKRLVVASARGGIYSGDAPAAAFDHQETYLRVVFGFMGVTDVKFIRAEGVALGEAARTGAIATAEREIARLAA